MNDERQRKCEAERLRSWVVGDNLDAMTLAEHAQGVNGVMRSFALYMTETYPTREEAEAQAMCICQSRYAHYAETAAKLKAFLDNPETALWK